MTYPASLLSCEVVCYHLSCPSVAQHSALTSCWLHGVSSVSDEWQGAFKLATYSWCCCVR